MEISEKFRRMFIFLEKQRAQVPSINIKFFLSLPIEQKDLIGFDFFLPSISFEKLLIFPLNENQVKTLTYLLNLYKQKNEDQCKTYCLEVLDDLLYAQERGYRIYNTTLLKVLLDVFPSIVDEYLDSLIVINEYYDDLNELTLEQQHIIYRTFRSIIEDCTVDFFGVFFTNISKTDYIKLLHRAFSWHYERMQKDKIDPTRLKDKIKYLNDFFTKHGIG